jgi:hypothetical protein
MITAEYDGATHYGYQSLQPCNFFVNNKSKMPLDKSLSDIIFTESEMAADCDVATQYGYSCLQALS